MAKEDDERYGTKQLVQGKKEALTERIEQIKNEEEPKHDHEKIHKMLVNNYKQAIGPHTEAEDGRVGVFNELLKEYTLAVIKSCMQVFAEAQMAEYNEIVKGRQGEDDCNS